MLERSGEFQAEAFTASRRLSQQMQVP